MDMLATRKPLSPQASRQPRRSRIACLDCRRRKVRCNVAVYGRPCTNCRLDGFECITRPGNQRNFRRSADNTPIADTTRASNRGNSHDECTAISTTARSRMSGLGASEMDSMDIRRDGTILADAGALHMKTAPNICSYDLETKSEPLLFFSYYPYLQAPNLRHLQPADVAFLESQKSLHVPAGPLLNKLLTHYFLYVHPCLPVIDEAEFWPMFHQRECGKSSFSLLVFQAMLFVACSYISLTEARKWGAESILAIRNSFYRRAKLLYDFGIEDDHLRTSQALTLLTFQSTGSDHLSNTTWLALAIQHARAVNAHIYHRYPTKARYKRSDLKRLWWCLVIRDRIIALGMRRSLQILPTHFDIASRDPLLLEDLADEIHASEVYDPNTKVMLCQILTSQCQLAVALTTLIMTVYPSEPFPDLQEGLTSESTRVNDTKSRLDYWKTHHMLLSSPQDSDCHTSISFYKQLTSIYFETARLALYHHISFRIYQRQCHENMPDMMNAVTAINDMVKRFVVDGTAGHLPISVVAYTVLPQMVLNFNLRLSGDNIGRRRQEQVLKIYSELNRQYHLRYDVSHVAFWIDQILRLFESSVSRTRLRTAELVHRERLSPAKGSSYLLELQPALYFQLASMLDSSMATGHLALEQPKSTSITSATDFSMPLDFPLCPELAETSSSRPRSDPHQFDQTMPPQPVLNIEDSATSTEEIIGHENMNRMLALSITNSGPDVVHLLDEETTDVDGSQLSTRDPASVDMLWSGIALFGE